MDIRSDWNWTLDLSFLIKMPFKSSSIILPILKLPFGNSTTSREIVWLRKRRHSKYTPVLSYNDLLSDFECKYLSHIIDEKVWRTFFKKIFLSNYTMASLSRFSWTTIIENFLFFFKLYISIWYLSILHISHARKLLFY